MKLQFTKRLALKSVLLSISSMILFTGCQSSSTAKVSTASSKPYPLQKCLVTDESLDHDTYLFVHEGQEIKLCCEGCKGDFDKEPAKFMAKIRAAK